jgi:hypothetical protein
MPVTCLFPAALASEQMMPRQPSSQGSDVSFQLLSRVTFCHAAFIVNRAATARREKERQVRREETGNTTRKGRLWHKFYTFEDNTREQIPVASTRLPDAILPFTQTGKSAFILYACWNQGLARSAVVARGCSLTFHWLCDCLCLLSLQEAY